MPSPSANPDWNRNLPSTSSHGPLSGAVAINRVLFVLCLIFRKAGRQSVDPNSQQVQYHRLQRYGLHILCSVGKQRPVVDAAVVALEVCRRVLNADPNHGWHSIASPRLRGWRTFHRSVLALGWGLPQRCRAALALELVAREPRMLPLQHPQHCHSPTQAASPGASQQLTGFRPCSSAVPGLPAPRRSQHQPHHHWGWPQLPVASRSGLAGCGAHLVVQGAVLVQLVVGAWNWPERSLQLHTGPPQCLAPHRPRPRQYLAKSCFGSGQSPFPPMAGHHTARECPHDQSFQPCENDLGPLRQPQSLIRQRHHAAVLSSPAGILVLGVQVFPVRTQPEHCPCLLLVVR